MTNLSTYQAAYQTAVIIPRPAVGRIWSTGATRIDLIHRMSTNELLTLQTGQGRATVLTNANARIVDRLIVLNLGERALLLTSPNRATAVRAWLIRYIFFNDDIQLTDAGETLSQIDLYGPQAAAFLADWLPTAADLPVHHVASADELLIVRAEPLAGNGYHLIAPPDQLSAITDQLQAAGAALGDDELLELIRIEAGLPGPTGEVNDQYIPLEASLWGDVSFSKGCYIGQEIIARMESRGRLAKTLVAVQASDTLTVGQPMRGPEGERGVLTSVTQSPSHGWLGLGFIKPSAAEPGTPLIIGDAMTATVIRTPVAPQTP